LAISITFIGIIFTANGAMFYKWYNPNYEFVSDFKNYKTDDPKVMALVALCFVFFMVLWAYGAYTTNKTKVSPYLINFLLGAKLYFVSCLLYPYISLE
jgi:amino acid transporter